MEPHLRPYVAVDAGVPSPGDGIRWHDYDPALERKPLRNSVHVAVQFSRPAGMRLLLLFTLAGFGSCFFVRKVSYMSWMLLYLAIVLEVAAIVCMKLSNGCTRTIPSVLMVLLYGVSFFPTAMALRRLDVGIAYAVWSAVGTTLITLVGIVLFKEQMSLAKMAALGIIIFGVVVLNLSGNAEQRPAQATGVVEGATPMSGSPTRVLLASKELNSTPSSLR